MAPAKDPQRGEALFAATCRTCHGPNSHPGQEATRPAANRPDVIADALANVAQMRSFASLYAWTDLEDMAAYLGVVFIVPAGPTPVVAVEYRHVAFNHYFVTAMAEEIGNLDSGVFAGWVRTGQHFNVYPSATPGSAPVCRFFTVAFPPASSHFYVSRGLGCEGTMADENWIYEGDVFHVALPDASGTCPVDAMPVHRLYNNGQGGAPNHRFTTSEATRREMLAQGYIAEGSGIGIGFCSPQ